MYRKLLKDLANPAIKRLYHSVQVSKRWVGILVTFAIFLFLFLSISSMVSRKATSVQADAAFQEEFRDTGTYGVVAGGVGTRGDPVNDIWTGSGTFTLTIPPGSTIVAAKMIWTGKSTTADADGVELAVDGIPVGINPKIAQDVYTQNGWSGGGTINLYHEARDITADLSGLGLSGTHSFTISDHEHATSALPSSPSLNFGVGLWIVYSNPSEPFGEVVIYQGMDSFYFPNTTPTGPHSLVHCAPFMPDSVDRVADMVHLVSGVDYHSDTLPGNFRPRSTAFWYEVGSGALPPSLAETDGSPGNPPTLSLRPNAIGVGGQGSRYPFESLGGLEWDTFSINGGINVAAGSEWACSQIESGDSQLLTGAIPNSFTASGMWNMYMLRLRQQTTQTNTDASLGNYVWLDENSDGLQDAGEPGIPNVIVNLTDSSSNVVTTTTDVDGGYLFDGLTPGTYTVTIPALNSSPGGSLEGLAQTTNPTLANADFGNQTLPYVVTLGTGDENLTADFGYIWNPDDVNNNTNNAALGDRVWVDMDSDGVQDLNEVGIAGVTLTLIGPGPDGHFGTGDDVTLGTDVTDTNGNYKFTNLPPGPYVVQVDDTTLPTGYTQSGDPDDFGQPAANPDNQTTFPVVLGPGDVFLNVDFGYNPDTTPVGRIGDLVWFDADASGTAEPIDAGEYGIPGVSVVLIQDTNGDGVCNPGDGTEPIIARDVTDENGRYLFDGLSLDDGDGDADYIVWVNDTDNVLDALTQTYDDNGVVTPDCSATALSSGTTEDLDQDFSYTPINHTSSLGAIGDTIWLNKDGDAVQDADEPGIEGVRVTLTLSNATTIETVTDENGRYYFGGLDPNDTYTVTVSAANFATGGVLENLDNTADPDGGNDNQSTVDLSATGPVDLDQDFGYTPATGQSACVGNLVWLDPNADGVYDGANGPDGLPGTDDDETVFENVTVDLYRDLNGDGDLDPGEPKMGTAVTNGTPTDNGCFTMGDLGNYIFTDLPAGDYIVDVTDQDNILAGYWHSRGTDDTTNNSQADPYDLSVAGDDDNLTADFGYYVEPAALGNYVWQDIDRDGYQDATEPGLSGVEVLLTIQYPGPVTVTLRTFTDSNGAYSFENLLTDEDYNGDGSGPEPIYTISVQTPAGFLPTPAEDVNGNADDLEDADDPDGVTAVPVQGLTDTTAQPDPTDEQTIASYDFGFVTDDTVYSRLGNYVWLDENADGLQDAGEPGIPNVVVNMTDGSGTVFTTTTDVDGGYLFDFLTAGTYTITIPALNSAANGPLEGMNQTTNPTLANADFGNQTLPYAITLGTGDENLTGDFGYIWNPDDVNNNTNNAALGDRVWVDSDSDGVQDPSEVGIEGVTVNLITPGPDGLFGTGDDVTQDTTTTDATGIYNFTNLPPGGYVVQVDDTTLPTGYTQTGDPDDFGQPASNPDHQTTDPVVLGPGDVFLNADFGYNPGTTPVGTIGDTVWFDADASGTATLDAGEYGIPGVTVVLIKDLDGNGVCSNVGDGTEPIIARDITDANGQYLFEDLPLDDGDGDADYIVWVNDTDNVLGELTQTYDFDGIGTQNCSATALDSGTTSDLDQDFSYTPLGHTSSLGAIGDTIWLNKDSDAVQDADEPGIEGVLVQLELPGGITRTARTDENGRYYFGALNPNDTFTVTVDASNFASGGVLEDLNNTADPDGGNDNQSVVDLSATGPIDLDQDFGYTPTVGQSVCIGNLIWLDTNANGEFDGENGPDGLPNTDDDEPIIQDVTVDLYRDLNGNGNLDPGEPKMETAVSTNNLIANGCANTTDLGNYIFTDLPAGDYVVDVTDQNNVLMGYWHSRGTDNLTDNSQADPYGLSVAANNDNLTADFGYYVEPAAVGNYVWFDINEDGLQDSGEPGMANVQVTLVITYPDSSVVTLQTLTDANGAYQFNNLLLDEDYDSGGGGAEPDFTISVQTPSGFVPTLADVNSNANDLEDADDPDGVTAVPQQGLTDTTAQSDPTDEPTIASYDFGFVIDKTVYSQLGNYVWLDENADGLQDAGEPGIPNVVVNMTDSTGAVFTTTTDVDGGYLFDFLSAGTYTITVPALNSATNGPLEGMSQTTNPTLPNADFGNQTLPYVITLGTGDENLTADFGYIWNPDDVNNNTNNAALGDRVWVDSDSDGVQDPSEVGIEGVTVNLINPGPDGLFGTGDDVTQDTTTTDVTGLYNFTNLPPGAYVVHVDDTTLPTGYTQTGDPDDFGQPASNPDHQTTDPVVLGPGDVFLNADFGYNPGTTPVGTIGDTVWFDADASGTATLDAGEYGIPGVTVVLIKDLDGNGVCSNVGDGTEPIIARAITDANGQYLFEDLPLDDGDGDADYIVWVNDTDNVLADLAQTYDFDGVGTQNCSATALNSGTTSDLDQDFSYTPLGHTNSLGAIGDTIWLNKDGDAVQDADEPGIEGVLVQLELPGGITRTAVTDENGRYYFGALDPNDTFTVTVDASNFASGGVLEDLDNTADPDGGNDNRSVVDLSATGPVDLDQDFGYTPTAGQSVCIGNLIWLDTNANGVFDGENGPDGLPNTDDDEPIIQDVTVDLYRDLNGNGLVDAGEPKIDTTVSTNSLIANGCANTSDLGNYIFTDLPAGDYVVDVTDQNNVLFGYWHSRGTDDLTDNSQADPFGLSVAANNDNVTADFGYYVEPAAVGNYVWFDVNEDGLQDSGEPGLENVQVTLVITYPDNTVVTLQTLTDANGAYQFNNLLLDEDYDSGGGGAEPEFTISVQAPSGFVPTLVDVNSNADDLEDSDNHAGVTAVPQQGLTDTTAQSDPTDEPTIASYDFGYRVDPGILSALGNYVWLDENADGLQDPGEPGIPNVTVNLTDNSGAVISTTVTDAHGGYLFPNLAGGVYTVTLDTGSLPAGVSQTTNPVLAGADFGNQTLPYQIVLGAGDENLTADFGFIWNPDDVNNNTGLSALGDCVWLDADGDGVRDPNEAGIGGVTVNLLGPGPDNIFGTADDVVLDTTSTDAACRYIFTDLQPGAYQVQVASSNFSPGGVLESFTQTGDPDDFGQSATSPDNLTTSPVVLAPGDVFLNADFGYTPAATCGVIGDRVWFDANASGTNSLDGGEYGIANVSVSLIQDTNGNGVWDTGELVVATDVTDSDGFYRFPCLSLDDGDGDADYLVWVNDTDNVLADLTQTYDFDGIGTPNLSATSIDAGGTSDLDQDFSYTPDGHTSSDGLIGDTIYLDIDESGSQDLGEPGLEGIPVQLELPNGSTISTVTDENGRYYFPGLDPTATYTVTVDTTGFLSSLNNTDDPDSPGAPDSTSVVDLSSSGPIDLDQDFGYGNSAGNTARIGNLVWTDTNVNGVFAGEDGADATPGTDDDELILEGVTLDLYYDANGNGRLDPNEPRVHQITTASAISATLYGSDGTYLFAGLPTADYIVEVSDNDGILLGYWHSLGTAVTDNNSQTDPYALSATAGADNLTADFGYFIEPAAVGNFTWQDVDGNGIQDSGEPALSGVTVTLQITYPSGTIITLTTVTDSNGYYEFDNLLLDEDFVGDGSVSEPTYEISVQAPGNLVPTHTDVNGSGGLDREDSDNPFGVSAQPVQGLTDLSPQADPNQEGPNASYDFGFHTPVRVGNRVWIDLDNDGVYEPGDGETGIPDVVLSLLDVNGDPVLDLQTGLPITAVTSITGTYAFNRVSSGFYIVSVDPSNFDDQSDTLFGFLSSQSEMVTDPVTDPDDGNDNDDNGVNILNPVGRGIQTEELYIQVATEPTTDDDEDGAFLDENSNLTVDFGFFEQLTLGNIVWRDIDNDGTFAGINEGGIGGVVLELLDGSGSPVLDPVTNLPITTTTDISGTYLFSYLFPDDYIVRISASNFITGNVLHELISSTGVVDPDNDVDSDDNGQDGTTPIVTGISSQPVTLAYNSETITDQDGDGNSNTNMTVDLLVTRDPTSINLISFMAYDLGGKQARIVWETAVETDNYGFQLFRSQTADFNSSKLVHTEYETHPNGAQYSYVDTVANAGDWYYWLVDIETDGTTTIHSPVKVVVTASFKVFVPMVINMP